MKRTFILVATAASICLSATIAYADKQVVHDIAQGSMPSIAADAKGHLYTAFESRPSGSDINDIFFSQSADEGRTWTAPLDISKTPGMSLHPEVAVDKSGAIDVVWSDTSSESSPDIFFSQSTDGGKTWSKPKDISNTPGVSGDPDMALGPDNSIHVVWTDTSAGITNRDIYYTSSTDGGKTWAKDPLLPAENISKTPGTSTEPTIAVGDDGVVHAAWSDNTSGEMHPDIYYTQKKDQSWSKPINISKTARLSSHAGVACGAKGTVYISWSDNSVKEGAADIWCVKSTKSGEFTKPINISNSGGISSEPAISADMTGHVAIVWPDTTSGVSKPDVFGRFSINSLSEYSKAINLSNSQAVSMSPDVTLSGNNAIVVWEEGLPGKSMLKLTLINLKHLATGSAANVEPTTGRERALHYGH